MSILGQQHNDPVTPALRASTQIKNRTARLAEHVIREWQHGFDALWHNPQATPAEVLEQLDTDAAEVFELSAATVQFLTNILSDRSPEDWQRISEKVAALPELIKHDDGTITIAVDE